MGRAATNSFSADPAEIEDKVGREVADSNESPQSPAVGNTTMVGVKVCYGTVCKRGQEKCVTRPTPVGDKLKLRPRLAGELNWPRRST